MSAATARRAAALRARAEHPATSEHEAAVCRELLARMEPTCHCNFCTAVSTDPVAAGRWAAIQADPAIRVLACGAWATTASPI